MRRAIGLLVFAAPAAVALPARAPDNKFKLWLNPSASAGLDARTSVELETAQRFRNSPAEDTYARLWLHREVARDVELNAGAERRFGGRTTIAFLGAGRRLGGVEVSLGYPRQQAVRDGAPDGIGHAPFVGLEFAL
jgi:hypothetical protein